MHTTIHRVSPGMRRQVRGIMWLCVLATVGLLLAAPVVRPPTTQEDLEALLVVCSVPAAGAAAMYLMDRVWFAPFLEMSDAGLKQVFPSGKEVEILWSQMAEVRNSPSMQRLIVRSPTGASINVEHQLVDFELVKENLKTLAPRAKWT